MASRRPALHAVITLAALLGPGLALGAGGAVPRGEDPGTTRVAAVRVLIEHLDTELRLTYSAEVVSHSDGYALVVPLPVPAIGEPEPPDLGSLAQAEDVTAPRWVVYSTGCGRGTFGGAEGDDNDSIRRIGVGGVAERADLPEREIVTGDGTAALAALEAGGFQADEADADAIRESNARTFLVLRAPPGQRERTSIGATLRLRSGRPVIDLSLLAVGATETVDALVLVASVGRVDVEGLPFGEMRLDSAGSGSRGDIEAAYAGALADRREAVADETGAAALLEHVGAVMGLSAGRDESIVSRYRFLLPPGTGPLTVSFPPSAASDRWHRVRAIVSADVGPWFPLALLLLALLARRRAGPALLALLLLAGCPSLSLMRGARPLPPGEHQWTASLAPARDVRHDIDGEPPRAAFSRTPRVVQPEVMYRYGWREGTDVGIRVFALGAKADIHRLLLDEAEAGVSVSVAPGLAAFVHPTRSAVCPKAPGGGDDGCFSSLFYGGLLDIPVTLSRRVSGHDLYFGIRYAHLVVSGATEYKASSRTFPSERVEKTVLQGLGGLFFGASLDIGDHRLIPELQIMVSPAAAGGIVWFPMAGIGIARPPER